MLLASNFILNGGANPTTPFKISPFLNETRNVAGALNPAREIRIPDCDVMQMILQQRKNLPYNPDFSMVAGDFVAIYSDPKNHEAWDACVSCFFIDTAPSIIEYFLVIHKMLIPGGVFINFGPLLYHWYAATFFYFSCESYYTNLHLCICFMQVWTQLYASKQEYSGI